MKTLKKITLVSFLIGSMLTMTLFVNGQSAKTAIKNVNYPPSQAHLSAGDDASICNDVKFKTSGVWESATDCGGKTIWKTNGDGDFANPFSLHTTYIPGEQDIKNGQVTLTLLFVSQGELSSIKHQDSMVLYLNKCLSSGTKLEQ